MEIIEKVQRVLYSCQTMGQLKVAVKYAELASPFPSEEFKEFVKAYYFTLGMLYERTKNPLDQETE